MPRNPSGTFTLAEAAFTPNTTISSAAVNSDLSDIATALTDSLSRTGEGGMSVALPLSTDGFFYSADPDTGMSRTAANTQVISVGGQDYTFTVDDLTSPAGTSLLPLIGELRMWAFTVAPSGWIFMRGQACTSTYPLWRAALISAGNPFGVSGSDPLFPNMQGAVPAGLDATGRGILPGSAGFGNLLGVAQVSLVTNNLPAYTPTGTVAITDPGHLHQQNTGGGSNIRALAGDTAAGGATQYVNAAAANTNSNTTGITAGFTGTPQGGTNTPISLVQPTIIINFIGRAG